MSTFLVFGASRGIGSALLRFAKYDTVVGISRSDFSAPDHVIKRKADALDKAAVDAVLHEFPNAMVVCTIGGTTANPNIDSEGTPHIIHAAKQSSAKHFVLVSSLGAGDSRAYASEYLLAAIGMVLDAKTKAEEALQASGLSYTIVRPGMLTDGEATGLASFVEDPSVHGQLTRGELARLILENPEDPKLKNKIVSAIGPASETSPHKKNRLGTVDTN